MLGREGEWPGTKEAEPGRTTLGLAHRLVDSPLVLGLVIFILVLGPRVTDLGVFVGPDEFAWVDRSAAFTRALAAGEWQETYQSGHPGVTLMWVETIGGWLWYGEQWLRGEADWTSAVGGEKTMAVLARKRQVIGVANGLAVVAAVLLIRRLFGAKTAWLAGFLLAFDPFLLTESRALRTEGVVTSASLLAVLSLLLYVQEPRWKYGLLAAVWAGLAILGKVSAVILMPVGILAVAGAVLTDSMDRSLAWRKAAGLVLAWLTAVILTIVLLWPALSLAPGYVFQQVYDYVAVRAVGGESSGGTSFFWGTARPFAELGPLFYPVVLLYRTSPWLWLGLLLFTLTGLRGLINRRRPLSQMPGQPLLRAIGARRRVVWAVILVYLVLYLVLIIRSDLKFDRYLLPVLPLLILLATLGLAAGWERLVGYRPSLAGWGWLAALLVLAGQVALAVPHHPYYYTYWNPLLGGLKQAAQVLPVGAGEGIEQVVGYLNSQPNAERLLVASDYSDRIKPLFKGRSVSMANTAGEWLMADYVFFYISQLQTGKYDPAVLAYLQAAEPVDTVQLHGLDYGWLYRGPGAQYYGGDTKLEGRATLHAYDLSETELAAGQTLTVTVYFRNEGQRPTDRFYVRLVDGVGYTWADGTVRPRPGFEDAFARREAIVEGEAALPLPVGMAPGVYDLRLGYQDTALGETVGEFRLPADGPRIEVRRGEGELTPAPPAVRLDWVVGDGLKLLGYEVEEPQWVPGEKTWLTLYWEAERAGLPDYASRVELVDPAGSVVASWPGRPVHGRYPTTGWAAGEIVADPWPVEVGPEVAPGRYGLRLAVLDGETDGEVAKTELGEVEVVRRRQRFETPAMQERVGVRLGRQVELLGYDLVAEPLPEGGRLRVALYWRGLQAMTQSYTVFVQLLGPDGKLVAQHDGLPGAGTIPTSDWAVGEVVADRHGVEFGKLAAGEYRLIVGMYDAATGERLPAANGESFIPLKTLPIR